MVSCYIRHLTNCTQNKIQLSRIPTLLEERDSVKKVKTDVFNYLGWNFLKSLTINLGSIKSLWTKCEQSGKGGNQKEVLEPVVYVWQVIARDFKFSQLMLLRIIRITCQALIFSHNISSLFSVKFSSAS